MDYAIAGLPALNFLRHERHAGNERQMYIHVQLCEIIEQKNKNGTFILGICSMLRTKQVTP